MVAPSDASGRTRPVTLVTVKRLPVDPLDKGGRGDKYGHWWFEIGDPGDPLSESYGWWPDRTVGLVKTLAGVAGRLNGAGVFLGGRGFRNPPPRDPHHGDEAPESFHPRVPASDPRTDAEIADCLRRFARGYAGAWRWTGGWGQNCHTFQRAALAHCGLSEP